MSNLKIRLAISFLLLSGCLLSQSFSERKGNKMYNNMNYAQAISYFSKAVGNDSSNQAVLEKLADCYRKTSNVKAANACYAKLIRTGGASSLQKYYYGQSLMASGKPADAKPYMDQYTSDARGAAFSKAISNLQVYQKDQDAYNIKKVSFNSPENDFSPVVFSDQEIVFASSRENTQWINRKHGWTDGSFYSLYSAKKDNNGNYEEAVLFSKPIQSKYNDGPVCFSDDRKTVYFTRNGSKGKKNIAKSGINKLKIFKASVTSDGTKFEKPVELPFNSKEYSCAHPSISADGKRLYFSSDMPGGFGGMDLYVTEYNGTTWGVPVNLGKKVNTAGNDIFPTISEKNILYFSSDGLDGLGGLDIYEAKIVNGSVGRAYNMGVPINSNNDDFGITFTKGMKSGFFSSNRESVNMDDNIYAFDVLRDVKRGSLLNVVVKDKTTGELLSGSVIKFCETELISNEKGEVQFDLDDYEDMACTLSASKPDYFNSRESISTKNRDANVTEVVRIILLEKDPGFILFALVTDAKSKLPLDSVTVKITDTKGKIIEYVTTETGEYRTPLTGKKIGDDIAYSIELSRPGYIGKTVSVMKLLDKRGEVKLHDAADLSLGKAEVGTDIGKLIDIKPIYFDVNKSDIRSDAAIELDKIVKAMNDFPGMVIELGSHTDCRSSKAYNIELSDKRAKSSAAYIISKGIPSDRIYGKGYGESKLINDCACEGTVKSKCSEQEHQANRRTEFVIVKLKG